jgi:hypothetical protein
MKTKKKEVMMSKKPILAIMIGIDKSKKIRK